MNLINFNTIVIMFYIFLDLNARNTYLYVSLVCDNEIASYKHIDLDESPFIRLFLCLSIRAVRMFKLVHAVQIANLSSLLYRAPFVIESAVWIWNDQYCPTG